MDELVDYCFRCDQPMPESVADWWLSSEGSFCSEKCAITGDDQ